MRSSRVPTSQRQGSQREKAGNQTFGSSADFAIYQLLSRNGLDPNKDVTLLSVAGNARRPFHCPLIGGSVEATVVNNPFEYRAEQKGFSYCSRPRRPSSSSKSPSRAEH